MYKNLFKYIFIFSLFIFGKDVFADDSGQIININQSYQIAFTDLGNRVLSQGDIVKVSLSADEFVYLQVLESSAILSKLGPSKVEGFQTNLSDFQRLAVGNTVVKISTTQGATDNSAVAAPAVADNKDADIAASVSQIQKLEQDLVNAKEEIRLLQESNEKSKATLNELMAENQAKKQEAVPPAPTDDSKEILGQLKAHLDNMNKLVNDNN